MHVTLAQMDGTRRHAHVAFARQVAMYACRVINGASFQVIGEAFNRDHGTVMHACRAVTTAIANREHRARHVGEIIAELSKRDKLPLVPATGATIDQEQIDGE